MFGLEDIKWDGALVSGIIFFVAGLLLSAYFWFNPRQIRGKIRYKCSGSRFLFDRIWSHSEASITIDVWNPSGAGLDGSDIREPLRVAFPDSIQIFDVAVVDTAGGMNPEAVTVAGVGSHAIDVTWNYLDPGMAFQLSMIPRPANTKGDEVAFHRPLRSAGRGWVNISGRFKDFVLEEPLDVDDLPDFARTTIGIAFGVFCLVALWVGAIIIYDSYPRFSPPELSSLLIWIERLVWVKAALVALFGVVFAGGALISVFALDSASKFILNTRSPIDRISSGKPEIKSARPRLA